jgi:hypothetical protein
MSDEKKQCGATCPAAPPGTWLVCCVLDDGHTGLHESVPDLPGDGPWEPGPAVERRKDPHTGITQDLVARPNDSEDNDDV